MVNNCIIKGKVLIWQGHVYPQPETVRCTEHRKCTPPAGDGVTVYRVTEGEGAMKILTSYKVRIKKNDGAFRDTAAIYNRAVDFFIGVCLEEWELFAGCTGAG